MPPIEDADDRATFVDVDEFGVEITWSRGGTPSTFDAIFSRPSSLADDDDAGTVQREARLFCRESDLPTGADQGDPVAVDGQAVSFLCKAIRPTGDGMAFVDLTRAS